MSRTRGRSDSIREDEELRLPRAPGLFRRFWARHPVLADVLIVGICLLLSSTTVGITKTPPEFPADAAPPLLFPALTVAACVTLLWRRRHPLLPFVAGCLLAMVLLLSGSGSPPLLLFSCYAIAVYGSTRAAWSSFVIGTTTVTATAFLLMALDLTTLQNGVNTTLSIVVFGLIGTLIGVNVGERKRYLAALIDRSRQLLVERDQQARLAAAAERARIAREMHDIVSHSLTVIVALSEGAVATPDREQARAASATAAETARGALTEMRSMLGVLRDVESPLPLAPIEPTPPHETVEAAQRAGFPATLAVTGSADVSPAVAHAIGRIVQEGVTNAMRHAPSASSIAVRLAYTRETVTIEIVNDGVSGPIGSEGFGLRGLVERAAHVGGDVRSQPADGGRWLLRAELPAGSGAGQTDSTEESA